MRKEKITNFASSLVDSFLASDASITNVLDKDYFVAELALTNIFTLVNTTRHHTRHKFCVFENVSNFSA